MSIRLNNNRGFFTGLTGSLILLLIIFSVASRHLTHAAEHPAVKPDRHLHAPVLGKGVLLIAGKELRDPNFEKTVVLITGFDEQGTTGLVINRRTKIPVSEVMPELDKVVQLIGHLYIGGPVAVTNVNLLIRSEKSLPNTIYVTKDIYLVNTLDQFNQLAFDEIPPDNLKLFSGLAGWAPGQLESELIRGDWYLWHAGAETVFSSSPDMLWYELIQIVTAKWVKSALLGLG
jgi:putative transcriptional regulator